ncbi:Bestrophin [Fasciola hepatica]|uniref:Bestrophin homolog n=1 Tax=Fasciola hepatica TaxID=6192 RepID=A0A4E0RSY8_FASHE|nr:Bestrophin [Fasciola hepatica]
MTVQYNQLVLTGGPGVFFRLLLKWRGCVFKLIYFDILVFGTLYAIISCIYRFALSSEMQRTFERLILFTNNFQAMIPVAFILGFYINLIFNRFWYQFGIIPWVLKFAIALVTNVSGFDDRTRLIRRTCVRYVLGSLILTTARISVAAKRRFPTMESFVSGGVFTDEEIKMIMAQQPHVQSFVPIVWATSLITLAEKERRLTNQHALVLLIDELNNFRQGLLKLFFMDYVCVPLVYTQVVTLSVYSYFIASLLGRQYIMESSPFSKEHNLRDLYFPFFTMLEFIIYMGWLKVAETLVNPMGEDDEDFDINEVIDFNWKTAWCIVDGMKPSPPAVVRDIHWHQSVVELPHTEESRRLLSRPCRGSVYDLNVQSTADYFGSGVSLHGGRRSQDVRGRRLDSILSQLNRFISSRGDEPDADQIDMEETELHAKVTSPGRPSFSESSAPQDNTPTTESKSPSVPARRLPSRMLAETITEEDEEDLDEYIRQVSDETNGSQIRVTVESPTLPASPDIRIQVVNPEGRLLSKETVKPFGHVDKGPSRELI